MIQAPNKQPLLRPPIKQARPMMKQPQKMYKPTPAMLWELAEEPLGYMVPCPFCEKRTIDVSELPEHSITLRFKCPHCRSLVNMPLVMAAEVVVIAAGQ